MFFPKRAIKFHSVGDFKVHFKSIVPPNLKKFHSILEKQKFSIDNAGHGFVNGVHMKNFVNLVKQNKLVEAFKKIGVTLDKDTVKIIERHSEQIKTNFAKANLQKELKNIGLDDVKTDAEFTMLAKKHGWFGNLVKKSWDNVSVKKILIGGSVFITVRALILKHQEMMGGCIRETISEDGTRHKCKVPKKIFCGGEETDDEDEENFDNGLFLSYCDDMLGKRRENLLLPKKFSCQDCVELPSTSNKKFKCVEPVSFANAATDFFHSSGTTIISGVESFMKYIIWVLFGIVAAAVGVGIMYILRLLNKIQTVGE